MSSNTIKLFSINQNAADTLGFITDECGGKWMGRIQFAEQMCELTNVELADLQLRSMPKAITTAIVTPDEDVVSSTPAIGGFYEWDSESACIVDLGSTYNHALAIRLHDSESGNEVILIRPEETLKKLRHLCEQIREHEIQRASKVTAQSISHLHRAGFSTSTKHTEPEEECAFCSELREQSGKRIRERISDRIAAGVGHAAEIPAPTGHTEPEETCALCAPAAPAEPEGTLLTNEVIAKLIQDMGAMRKRIDELESKQVDLDSLQRMVENEVEKQIDGFDFRQVIKDAIDDMDLFNGESFCEAVKEVIDDQDLDSDEVETIVHNMDLRDKLKETMADMDMSEVICPHIEKMDMATVVSETLDGMQLYMKIEGTHEDSGSLRVTFGS